MAERPLASKRMLAKRLQHNTVEGGGLRRLSEDEGGSTALGAWFLGPKAENEALLLELVRTAVERHAKGRREFFPNDPEWLTAERKQSGAYQDSVKHLHKHLSTLLTELDGSVPFFSYRYQGHMLWDVTLPAVVGYFAAMLYNQNNVAAEASPVTTWLEMIAADELCLMLGYYVPPRNKKTGQYEASDKTIAWGHITCDGSVANSEALWAARNLKYYALGLASALTQVEALRPATELQVRLPSGQMRPLIELGTWELLNLEADEVLELRQKIKELCPQELDLDAVLSPYLVQDTGLAAFQRSFAKDIPDPVLLCPATAHYSWPKAAALLGLGRSSTCHIKVDLDARLDIAHLRQLLDTCLHEQRPILMLVVVLGTTEESAVDPVAQVLRLREEYRKRGLEFWVHVDAAWGGYFASMLREPAEPLSRRRAQDVGRSEHTVADEAHEVFYGPRLVMSEYVQEQYSAISNCDSITIDPHKAGYIPYPAGGLCYRNSTMRHLVAFSAPIVYHGGVDPTVGVFGIEGSKPGAAAAAVYLSHRVIRTDQSGYGLILGRCMWNSKRLYCALATMARVNDPFRIVLFQRLPSERSDNPDPAKISAELRQIELDIVPKTNEELLALLDRDERMRLWFGQLGSDQVILSYAFNFLRQDGSPNPDPELMNHLNQKIFERLSLGYRAPQLPETPLFVTSSRFDPANYGERLVGSFCARLGVAASEIPIDFLLSTTMNPWLTDTADGDFVPRLIDVLRTTVLDIIRDEPAFR